MVLNGKWFFFQGPKMQQGYFVTIVEDTAGEVFSDKSVGVWRKNYMAIHISLWKMQRPYQSMPE
jgi:hypothetical protein